MVTASLHRYLSALVLFLLPAGAGGVAAAKNTPVSAQVQQAIAPLTTAAPNFVQDILSRAGSPSAVSVSFQNFSQLTAETQQAAQDAILNSFRGAGVRLVKPEMAQAEVQVTFSEDWQGYVWIGQIQQGPGKQLVISRLPRPERANSAHAPTLTLRKSTIWIQDGQILDFFVDNQNLVLLEPAQISVYANDNGQWRQRYTLSITRTQPWPRDLRGKLQVNGGQLSVFLPGKLCAGSLSPPSLDCRSSDDPWPLDQGQLVAFFSARRNFFNGILAGPSAGVSVAPFFSAATWPGTNQRQWLFTGTDGRARFYLNDLSTPAATFNAWGSNLAVVHSGCSTGWQVLVSSSTDSVRPDSVEAVEVAGREAQTVSPAIDVAGPISVMWTSGKNSETVNGVMHLTSTGKYEAFILTVSCN
jgi:hypothetical protein